MTALRPEGPADLSQENIRLRAELRAMRDRQAAAAEILHTIAGAPGDAGRSLQQIAETSARLFGAPSVSLQLAENGEWGQAFRFGKSAEQVRSAIPLAAIRIGGRNLPGTVIAENRQIHIPDLDNIDPSMAEWPGLPPARAAGTRTMCGTPLRREGSAIGVLIVYRDRLLPFTDEELVLQQSFADQAVIAIENARLFNETREALERQTATADILKVIASSPSDVQPVFEAIAESANRLLGGFSSAVFRFLDGTVHLAAFTPVSSAADAALKADFPRSSDEFEAFGLAQQGKPFPIPDTEEVPHAPIREIARLHGFRSMLFVPLMNGVVPIGIITVTRLETGAFSPSHIQLLQTFADQAVIAIENVRLFEQVQAKTRDLSEALQQQTATADVLKVISRSAFDLDTVMNTLARSAAKLCDADFSGLFFRDGDFLALRGMSDVEGKVVDFLRHARVPIDDHSHMGRAILNGTVANVPDFDSDTTTRVRTFREALGFRAMLIVPMIREGRGIGVFGLCRNQVGEFSQRQIELVQTFADQAVIAIENARLFEEVQARTKELSQSLDELRTAQDRLVQTEKLASLGQLTAGIAHEIKNPLNFVNNFAALSAELTDELNDVLGPASLAGNVREEVDELTSLLKDNLQKVVQHGKRADSIVKNMLLHSREGSGEHRPADINALLDESLNLAYHGARAEKPQFNVTLQRDFDAMAGMIELFPQEITRVFLNLISNGFYAVTKRKSENGGSGFRAGAQCRHAQSRRRRGDPHSRQRHRHPGRSEGKDVQPVLYDQAGR